MARGYEQWNSWLLERNFPAGRPGVPVYLEIHDSLLEEGAEELGLSGSGIDFFIESILTIGRGGPQDVFPELARMAREWRSGDPGEPPPFVAGLGFAVLAASEMRTEPAKRATAANYYIRLNQLLGLGRRGQPPGFEATWAMWQELRSWLSANRRGDLVVRGLDGARKYVDPVKSQCLVRTCDLSEFGGLLRRIHRIPGREFDPEDMAPFLSRWLRGEGANSRLARILGKEPAPEMLYLAAEALADRIEVWGTDSDSEESDETEARPSRATLQAEPHYHPHIRWKSARWAVAIFADAAVEYQSVPLSIGDRSYEAKLDYFEPPRFVCSVGLDSVAEILGGNTRLVASGVEAHLAFDTPLWLEVPPGSNRPDTWEPTNSLSAGLEYQVVFREEEFDRLAGTYGTMLEEGYELLEGAAGQWPGPGLFALCSARIVRGEDLPDTIGFSSVRERLRLLGGLKIARRTYLQFALPSVERQSQDPLLIVGENGRTVTELEVKDLNELDLSEGVYSIRAGTATATFAVSCPRWGEVRALEGRRISCDWKACLDQGRSRGALVKDAPPRRVMHLEPGRKVTVYHPGCQKINVPSDEGIFELNYTGEFTCVIRGSTPAEDPLPLHDAFSVLEGNHVPITVTGGGDDETAEKLLHFISARASGPIERLRAPCQLLSEDGEPWHRVLQLYEALGHVDVDWDTRRWFAAPPVLCQRSSRSGGFFAAGVRTRDFRQTALTGLVEEDRELDRRGRHVAPRMLLYSGAYNDVDRACKAAGIGFPNEPPADNLLMRLRPITETDWWLGPAYWPPTTADRLERWQPLEMRWCPAAPKVLLDRDPRATLLVRWQDVGLTRIVLVTGPQSRLVKDPSAAKWFLAPRDVSLLRYVREELALEVPRAMGLPRPYLRAAVLAAGLPPKPVRTLDVYDYFSLRTARLLAVRLDQKRAPGLW